MTLAEKLGSYEEDYWDFSEYRNEDALVRYPAVMVAPMQECILKEIIAADNTVHNVLDPFFGSGTVLHEGQKLGLDVLGFDINPLAALITKVQLEGIPQDKARDCINALSTRITMLVGNVSPHNFTNIKKWFNDEVILSLSVIRQAIMGEPDKQIRRFFWCCFAETVKRYSNTRTSTFKLHIKNASQINSTIDDSIDFFRNHIQVHYRKLLSCKNNEDRKIDVRCGDSKHLLTSLPSNSIDLIYTSPPYGDNHTTVTYGQFSILPLLWIDKGDLMLWDETLLDKFTAIDTASLGGTIKRERIRNNVYSEYLHGISPAKQKKVIAFLEDYELIYGLLARVLKPGKLMVLTLGNRRVDNQEIRFDLVNDNLAKKFGLELDSTISRKIVGKRMPSKVSTVKNCGAVNSMSKEYIKIYRKVITND
jgi:site-specific DNA-methyltransferase (cytosine-N4-specific)